MSTLIFNLSSTPDLVNASDGQQIITIGWDASMTGQSDNPVRIQLNLHPDSPVYFISSNNRRVKTVEWRQNLQAGFHHYQDDVTVVVIQPQPQPKATTLRMDSLDSGGIMSHSTTYLMYQ